MTRAIRIIIFWSNYRTLFNKVQYRILANRGQACNYLFGSFDADSNRERHLIKASKRACIKAAASIIEIIVYKYWALLHKMISCVVKSAL